MVDEGLMDKIAIPTPRGNAACLQLTDKGKEYLTNPSYTSPSKEKIDAVSPAKKRKRAFSSPMSTMKSLFGQVGSHSERGYQELTVL